jgi:ABC-2 type transport system ATP-binding protein
VRVPAQGAGAQEAGGVTARASSPAIAVAGLAKRYGTHVAVAGTTFDVERGEAFGILGPNGAGKTTTLEMIEGLRPPDAGSVEVLGMRVWPDPTAVQRRIGVQLQSTTLFEMLSARELLELFARFYSVDRPADAAEHAIELVGLQSRAHEHAQKLSGGQQQRLAIAIALVHDPEVVFLDEPTTGLDPQARHNLWEVIRRVNREEGKTVVLTTHYIEEAEQLCDRVAIMDDARVIALDTPSGLIASLQADARVSFVAEGLDAADLPAVSERTELHGQTVLYTRDTQATVLGLLERARGAAVTVSGLSVHGPSLEDVFLHLTGKEFRE